MKESQNNFMTSGIWKQLAPVKVLEFTDAKGFFCGRMLADLGAQVIKIEPPGGDAGRIAGEGISEGLYWLAYNAGKSSITLDLSKPEGQTIFKGLTGRADILIVSRLPSELSPLGADYASTSKLNPALIYTSITPFGATGPWADYKVTDLVAEAVAGPLFLTGDKDRPPVRNSVPQAFLHAGAEAAVATMMALYQKKSTGCGQFIDVSIQDSLLWATFNSVYTWVTEQTIILRMGSDRMIGKHLRMPQIWPCKDGFISFTVLGGVSGGKMMRNLGSWMEEKGLGDRTVSETDWAAFDFYGLTTEMVAQVVEPITRFFSTHTKQELFDQALKREVMLFPVADAEGILDDRHLAAKGFWQQTETSNGHLQYPRPPVRVNDEYAPYERKVPTAGADNREIYGEWLGMTVREIEQFKRDGVI
jgi:crotonobetainyl-CoA:carnitine CoA-transferase CaiB-like acyl-CoA transferase